MHNLYEQFRQLIPDPPLQAGTVVGVGSGVVTVALPGGGLLRARGSAAIGQKVFVRDDVIEGVAPNPQLHIINRCMRLVHTAEGETAPSAEQLADRVRESLADPKLGQVRSALSRLVDAFASENAQTRSSGTAP